MKIRYNDISFLMLFLLCLGCNKDHKVDIPDFDVSVEKVTVGVNEEVMFSFQGEPRFITFYSGEIGQEYSFKDVERMDGIQKLAVSFETHNEDADWIEFSVMYSNDFVPEGSY